MNVKDYLVQEYRIDQRINSKIEQVISLHELATKATSTLSDMPHNSTKNIRSMENTIVKIVELENEINGDIDTLIEIKHKIVTAIKGINNLEFQTLLELRYLCFRKWEQIAVDMGYSVQHIYRLHDKAIENMNLSKDESKCDGMRVSKVLY